LKIAIYSWLTYEKMYKNVIFHGYISFPEGTHQRDTSITNQKHSFCWIGVGVDAAPYPQQNKRVGLSRHPRFDPFDQKIFRYFQEVFGMCFFAFGLKPRFVSLKHPRCTHCTHQERLSS